MTGITDPSEVYFKDGLRGWCVNHWNKLVSDAAGHLQVDVVASGLPAGGATSANQTTMITALQLIDDLRAALNSVATDELDTVFDGQNMDVEVTQQNPADLTPGIEGWLGAAWHKLAMLWGYSAHYAEEQFELNAAAGVNSLNFGAVPVGEVWVVHSFTAYSSQVTTTHIELSLIATGIRVRLIVRATGVALITVESPSTVVMHAGDNLRAVFTGCGAGDNIYAYAHGYKMVVNA